MDESNSRSARWIRRCGLISLSLWLAACAPLPVAQTPEDLPACRLPVGGGEGDISTQPCPEPAKPSVPLPPLQPLDPLVELDPPKPRMPRTPPRPAVVIPPVGEPAPPASPYELSPPRESDQQGLASWYGERFHGRRTASGERFDSQELTAAHRTLAFGTRVCVRSAVTGKVVVVRINDRGPFSHNRVIDLSQGAAEALGMVGLGIKPVELWQLEEDEDECPEMLEEGGRSYAGRKLKAPAEKANAVARKKAPVKKQARNRR
ncbi:septal ring lytic transglycosylase RlpA family protein [Comamonas endophytica]|uniref:septal ring lytic transglycosylase RlpA family protein n=1 Tax=Comamonas endophytica TaxID=2949090 RepID=UPI003BEF1936